MSEPVTDEHGDGFDPAMQDLNEEQLEELCEPAEEISNQIGKRRWRIVIVLTLGLAIFLAGLVAGFLGKKAMDNAALKAAGVPDPVDGWKELKYIHDVTSVSAITNADDTLYYRIRFKNGEVMDVPASHLRLEGTVTLPGIGNTEIEIRIGEDGKLYVRTIDQCVDHIAFKKFGE